MKIIVDYARFDSGSIVEQLVGKEFDDFTSLVRAAHAELSLYSTVRGASSEHIDVYWRNSDSVSIIDMDPTCGHILVSSRFVTSTRTYSVLGYINQSEVING